MWEGCYIILFDLFYLFSWRALILNKVNREGLLEIAELRANKMRVAGERIFQVEE